MPSAEILVFVAFHCFFLVTSIICNSFILIVHFINSMKTRKTNPCDLIINFIATINIILQASVATSEICLFLFQQFYIQCSLVNYNIAIMSSLTFSGLCCATCLCFYYCVKIVNINGALFYKIKTNITLMVPWLLLFSNVISLASGLAAYWDLNIVSSASATSMNGTRNNSSIGLTFVSRCNCLFQVYMFESTLAFIIISVTAIAIIVSLCKHMQEITKNTEGFGNTRLRSLKSAAQTVTSLLILYLVIFASLNFIFNETEVGGSSLVHPFFVVAASCPTLNAVNLINGNRKLSNMVKRLLGMKSSTIHDEVTNTTT